MQHTSTISNDRWNKLWIALGLTALAWLWSPQSLAGVFELGGNFGFSRSVYSSDSFTWTRQWGASLGYHFTEHSGVEVGWQQKVTRTLIPGFQDTVFNDNIYSLTWVQGLLGRGYRVQPYFKIGVGQLNRDASGEYAGGVSPSPRLDSLTIVATVGTKIYILQQVALKIEGTSYLTGGEISTYRDNFSFVVGGSFYF